MATQTARQFPADPFRAPSSVKAMIDGARILFLVDEISITKEGGAQRQILQMIDICNQSGLHPQVCVLRETNSLTSEVAGCPVTHFPLGKSARLRSTVRLARWIREQNIDVLQTFFPQANLIGPYAGRLAGVPVILGTRRNLDHARADRRSWLQQLANRLATQVLANSQAVLDRTVESERIAPERICVLHNGIDLARMRPTPELRASTRERLGIADDQILVGNISALCAIKGVQMFVNASADAYRRDHRLRFLLVGNGDLKVQLNQTIRIYGLQGIIRLYSAVEDVRPYLAAFDVAVLCSQTEGFSNSLLEYMAAGLPIIATDVGGNREALGSSGLLIRPDVHELTAAIHSITAPHKRADFGIAALAKVKEFDLPVARERLTELYEYHLSQGAARKRRPRAQSIAHMAA
jgi:glycosyltransferase involved in cell wall biosynthesis